MGYLSAADVAARWGVSERSVRNYCAQGRIPGAVLIGRTWSIPEAAEKPARLNARLPQGNTLVTRLLDEKEAGIKGGIYHKVQTELAYNSNHMEGSRLSLDQTRLIFETSTLAPDGASVRIDDIFEAVNHFKAVDYILDSAFHPMTQAMMKTLHRMLKLGTSDAEKPWFGVGEYKRLPNEVAGRKTAAPEDVEREIAALLKDYGPKESHSLRDIIEFHVGFERIHPFQDGNGRVGRLLMFKECLSNGIAPFVIEDEMKGFYYRGLSEWGSDPGYLVDTCLAAQDRFKAVMDYFRIDL